MERHCCKDLERAVQFNCETCADQFECPDSLVLYVPKFDEYGLIIHNGGTAFSVIRHCPWCGSEFPESKRDRWFRELEAMGIEEPDDERIPDEYQSDSWYQAG